MNYHLFAGAQFIAPNLTAATITRIEVIKGQTEIFFKMNYVDGLNTNEEESLQVKSFLLLLQQFNYQVLNAKVA